MRVSRIPFPFAALTIAALAVSGGIAAQQSGPGPGDSEAPTLLWYLSGDRGLLADQEVPSGPGDPNAYGTYFNRDPLRPRSIPGHRGSAVEARGPDGEPVTFGYKMRGNVNLFAGTLSCWFRLSGSARSGRGDRPVTIVMLTEGECQRPYSASLFSVTVAPWDGELVATFADRLWDRTSVRGPAGAAADGNWHHLALTWDWTRGQTLYLDGRRVAGNMPKGGYLPPRALVARLYFGDDRARGAEALAIDEARIYDTALTADAIQALFEDQPLPTRTPEEAFSAGLRERELGWTAAERDAIPAISADGRPWRLRQAVFDAARALKNPAWLAVDGRAYTCWPRSYKYYLYAEGGGLHVSWTNGPVNQMRLTGSFYGDVFPAPGPERPAADRRLFSVDQPGYVLRRRFERPLTGRALSFWRRTSDQLRGEDERLKNSRSRIVDLDLYHLAPGTPVGLKTARVLYLTPSGHVTDPLPREELVNHYPVGDRALLGASLSPADMPPGRISLRSLRFHHLLAPAETESAAVAGLRLRLRLEGVGQEDTLLLTIHHPVNRACAVASYDLRVRSNTPDPLRGCPAPKTAEWGRGPREAPSLRRVGSSTPSGGPYPMSSASPARVDLTVDCRDFVLPAGAQLWVSLVSRSGASLVTGGADGSRIEILTRDRPAVLREYLAGQVKQMGEFFLAMSEPRPWHRTGTDERPLSGCYPHYEELCRMLRDARALAPDDPDLRALYLFTHPQDPANMEVAWRLPIPRENGAPDWAVLAREVMGLMRHHVHWWLENKATPNGELGMIYGDDTDFYQDIGNLVFLGGAESPLRDAILRLNEFLFSPNAITYEGRPQPLITDGLNTLPTDPLHVYEEGLNQEAMAVLMDYGNPLFLERCMATARRYDQLFPRGPEGRYLAFQDFGSRVFRQPGRYSDGALIWHPGLMLLWYNDNPVVKQQAAEYTDYILTHTNGRRVGGRYGGIDVLFAAWRHTGSKRYLRALTAAFQETGVAMDARLWDYADLSAYAAKTLEACRRVDFEASLRTTSEGISDSDFFSDEAIVAYRISRRKEALAPMLRGLYRRLKLTMPVLTYIEQSNDRVHIGKHAVDRMYLGGLALTRCMVYPHHAVSYEGLTENFAALVVENGDERLKVVLFNFEDRPQQGRMRVWRLVPGKYEVAYGPDRNDDDAPDTITGRKTLDLIRGAPIPLELPSRVPWVVTVRRIEKATPLYERPDLAVTAMDARWDAAANALRIPVHSIGAKSTGPYEVVVSDPAGKTLLRRSMPALEAPLDLHPRVAVLEVPDLHARGIRSVTVTLDPDNRIEEITEENNRATIAWTEGNGSG